ncbi:hypothetical protein Dimus_002277 [Dionaea muscipula]
MELHALLPSPTVSGTPASLSRRRYLVGTPQTEIHLPRRSKLPQLRKCPSSTCTKPKLRAQLSSGTTKFISNAITEIANSKDEDLVFVAGATGRVGSRTVRELLKLGFRVRAGVRNAQRAESLIQACSPDVEKLELVECDLEKRDEIGPALGNASVVICCIGASEKEVFDITGPYRIDYLATKNLIDAATIAKVDHFIMVSSLGTNKVGFPAAILNLFWGVLLWKRKAEEALIASSLPYTIVRPGGMERPTDSFKETHNIRLSPEDTLFGGQVSNLQVAELMAFMAKNSGLSYYKVVEVIAETTAPLRPFRELLLEIPSQNPEINPSKGADSADYTNVLPVSGIASEAPAAVPVKQESAKAEPDELNVVGKPDPDHPISIVSEVLSTPTEKELPKDKEDIATRPSSPYTAYEDLKPPTSPSPNPPCEPSKVTFNSSTTAPEVPPPSFGDENGAPNVVVEDSAAVGNGSSLQETTYTAPSPHPVLYDDDFKLPTSPSPRSRASNSSSSSSSESTPPEEEIAAKCDSMIGLSTGAEDQTVQKQHCVSVEPKPRPLSPYTMYEDMKPPTTPRPSPRNST